MFYEKLPLYDISSHKHKFLNTRREPHKETTVYGNLGIKTDRQKYDPPLPTSVITSSTINCLYNEGGFDRVSYNGRREVTYEPPLPTSVLQFKSEKGKHKTQKPTTMMDWILKYYSKEGDTVLDPTMGSGSTGVSCKSMNREFIGIDMDEEIYKVACDRLK